MRITGIRYNAWTNRNHSLVNLCTSQCKQPATKQLIRCHSHCGMRMGWWWFIKSSSCSCAVVYKINTCQLTNVWKETRDESCGFCSARWHWNEIIAPPNFTWNGLLYVVEGHFALNLSFTWLCPFINPSLCRVGCERMRWLSLHCTLCLLAIVIYVS